MCNRRFESDSPDYQLTLLYGPNRVSITRLLWAMTLSACAFFCFYKIPNQHQLFNWLLLVALLCAVLGAVVRGHIGAWCGFGIGAMLVPVIIALFTAEGIEFWAALFGLYVVANIVKICLLSMVGKSNCRRRGF